MLGVFLGLLPYLKSVSKYIKLEKREGTSIKRILEKLYINATLLKLNTDWLHFGFATMAIDRELVAKAIGAQLAVSLRGYDIDVYPLKDKNCYNFLWQQLDKVHSISDYLHHKAVRLGLSSEISHEIITPAVDLDKFRSLSKYQAENSVKLKLLTIARLHWIKGIDNLIEIAYFLKEKNLDFEWKVIGGGDSKHTERYLYHVYQRKLENEIEFVGRQSHFETLELLHQSDLYVQTSLSEGFCNAVLEAQALSKLCVAYDAGALSENIVHEETGWLVQKAKPELLANKILEVLNHDEKIKKSIRGNAKERVQNQFSLEVQKKAFAEFYL
jgi:colanic acid/amylovoran biosynthesis glycosyltransferase